MRGDARGRHAATHPPGAIAPATILIGILIAASAGAAQLGDELVPPTGPWVVDEDLTVGDETRVVDGNLTVRSGATLRLEGSHLLFTDGHGVLVESGGRLEMADGGGHGATIGPQTPGASFAFRVEGHLGAFAPGPHTIEGVSTGDERMGALVLAPGTGSASLASTTIRGNTDAGVLVGPGASLTGTGLTLSGVGRTGLLVGGTGTVDVNGLSATGGPVAVNVRGLANVRVGACTIDGSTAAVVLENGGTATLDDCTIGGRIGVMATQASSATVRAPRFTGYTEAAVVVTSGSDAAIDGALVDGGGVALFGVLADGAGTVSVADSVVRGHVATYVGTGHGILARDAARLDVSATELADNAGWGLSVTDTPHAVASTGTGNGEGLWRSIWTIDLAISNADGTPAQGADVTLDDGTGAVELGPTDENGVVGPLTLVAQEDVGAGPTSVGYTADWVDGSAHFVVDGPGRIQLTADDDVDAADSEPTDEGVGSAGQNATRNGTLGDRNATEAGEGGSPTGANGDDPDATGDATADVSEGNDVPRDDGDGTDGVDESAALDDDGDDMNGADGDATGSSDGEADASGTDPGPQATPGVSLTIILSSVFVLGWAVSRRH